MSSKPDPQGFEGYPNVQSHKQQMDMLGSAPTTKLLLPTKFKVFRKRNKNLIFSQLSTIVLNR